MQAVWDQVIAFATTAGIKIIISLILLVIGFKIIKVVLRLIGRLEKFSKIDESAQSFLRSFISLGLNAVLLITIAAYLGIPMTSVIALLASAGLAIGLALQGALSNFAGGLMLLIFKPFHVGDFIDTHSDMGTVLEINIFYTVLKTPDNRHITLPNGSLSNSGIVNFSVEPQRRVDLTFTTGYDADIEAVKKVLLSEAAQHELTLAEPEPFARLREHGDSALVFTLRVWCQAADYWTIYFDLIESVKQTFDAQGIAIPYPQLDVHLNQ